MKTDSGSATHANRLKTTFPANTMTYVFRKNKPFEQCFDLDDAYEEFKQMGFYAVILEVERLPYGPQNGFTQEQDNQLHIAQNINSGSSSKTLSDYVLIVGDYAGLESTNTKNGIDANTDSVLTKMSKMINEKPIAVPSEKIEERFCDMGLNPKRTMVLGFCDTNNQPSMHHILQQNRERFVSSSDIQNFNQGVVHEQS